MPAQAVAPVPAAGAEGTYEERLQALEAGQQQLTARLDALQEAPGYDRAGAGVANARLDQVPAEAAPVKPGIVLAASTRRQAPMPPPEPAPVLAPVRQSVPPTAAPAPARQSVPPETPAVPQRRPGKGEWVINLASYTSESFAASKRAEFVKEGVAAEQVETRVDGQTVYRLRVPGFESFREASAEAKTIKSVLGLEDTWIARR
jgi:hypothetical protein